MNVGRDLRESKMFMFATYWIFLRDFSKKTCNTMVGDGVLCRSKGTALRKGKSVFAAP